MTIVEVFDLLTKGGLLTGALLVIYGAGKGWWVTAREFNAKVIECENLKAELKAERDRNDKLRELSWTLAHAADKALPPHSPVP